MKLLRDLLDKQAPMFEEGGRFHWLYPLYEANDTVLFTPGHVTKGRVQVRDALDLKRMMITVVVALLPCVFMAFYNTGYQANTFLSHGATALGGWQASLYASLGFTTNPASFVGNMVHGGLYYLPVLLVTFIVGGVIEVAFAAVRKHEVNEGFLVTGMLFPLTLPPTIPLWQVALGIAFGVIVGKELFGGTGMNIMNPALTGRAFLFFSYPAQISGDKPWIAADTSSMTDGVSGATNLARAASWSGESYPYLASTAFNEDWWSSFMGFIPGSMGETSTLACVIGALILILTQVGSWRTMLGCALGTAATASFLNLVAGSVENPMFQVSVLWHYVIGSWAFAVVFMATDPVSSSFTERGKLFYGLGIGTMGVLVRVVNPAYPEGMMLAILFMNMFAPLLDHFVVQANIKRRMARNGA